MLVDWKMTMAEYDQFTSQRLQGKIPDLGSGDRRRRLGDSIYDFSQPAGPRQRAGVHYPENMATDLDGMCVLMSRHWYYFGRNSISLPASLRGIVHQGQNHKSRVNAPYVARFLQWIEGLEVRPNILHGKPQMNLLGNDDERIRCATGRRREAEQEERFFTHSRKH